MTNTFRSRIVGHDLKRWTDAYGYVVNVRIPVWGHPTTCRTCSEVEYVVDSAEAADFQATHGHGLCD